MALLENYAAALDEVLRLKPSAAKGRYLRKITFTTTMGPGIPVDPNKTRGFLDEEVAPSPKAELSHQRRRSPGGGRRRWRLAHGSGR